LSKCWDRLKYWHLQGIFLSFVSVQFFSETGLNFAS